MLRDRITSLMLPALLVVTALIGCTTSQTAGELIVNEDSNGKQIEVRTGQTLVVALKGNPTTGYTWEILNPPAFLLQQGEAEFKPDSNLIGAPGRLTFRFKLTAVGQGKLAMIYHRPWEKEVAPIETFSLDIVAK